MSACDSCPSKNGCTSQDTCGKKNAPSFEPMNSNSSIKKVIGIASGKGGVGKSFVTTTLAVKLASQGLKVGIMDADITGPSIPRAFGLKEMLTSTEENHIIPATTKGGIKVVSLNLLLEDETAPVIWRGPVISGLVRQFWTDVDWGMLDVLLIDMPPGTGDVPLTVFQSLPVDGIIVVASPQQLVRVIVEKAVNMANMMNIPILGLVENMSYVKCPDCGKQITVFGKSNIDVIAKSFNLPVLARIPMEEKTSMAVDAGDIESLNIPELDEAAKTVENLLKK